MKNSLRCKPGLGLLADALERDKRTVRRWIQTRSELRTVLRAYRSGKQWRIKYPDAAHFDQWVQEIKGAVAGFTHESPKPLSYVRAVCKGLGFIDGDIESELKILQMALETKRAGRKIIESPDDFQIWKQKVKALIPVSRMVSAQFGCGVFNSVQRWRDFLMVHRERSQQYNKPYIQWLRENGLEQRSQELLRGNPRAALIAFISLIERNGRRRARLYRQPEHCRRDGRWRALPFQVMEFSLLPTQSDEEIAIECAEVEELWPSADEWARCELKFEQDWKRQTLAEAAVELLREDLPVTGKNLAPLLFRKPIERDSWRAREAHIEMQKKGYKVLPVEDAFPTARRGISIREFRQRYARTDIREAEQKAALILANSVQLASEHHADYREQSSDDGRGGAKIKNDFVSHQTASRVRGEFAQMGSDLSTDEIRAIEQALGCSLEDYAKDPFREIN